MKLLLRACWCPHNTSQTEAFIFNLNDVFYPQGCPSRVSKGKSLSFLSPILSSPEETNSIWTLKNRIWIINISVMKQGKQITPLPKVCHSFFPSNIKISYFLCTRWQCLQTTPCLIMTETCGVTCTPDLNPKQSGFYSDHQRKMFQ